MMAVPGASPDPLANYWPPGRVTDAEETERRLALVWATLAARRDPATGARRVMVLPPVAFWDSA